MDPTPLLDGLRELLRLGLMLAAPALVAALAVGLVVGLLQTMTQLHEPTVALVPRLIVVALAVMIVLPWMVDQWTAYASDLWRSMPEWVALG